MLGRRQPVVETYRPNEDVQDHSAEVDVKMINRDKTSDDNEG